MRTFFTTGTTGPSKHITYDQKTMDRLEVQMEALMKEYGVWESDKVLNSFSLFPCYAPNLGYWQSTMIGKYDHINHFDIGSIDIMNDVPESTLKMLKGYKPHIVMGDPNVLMTILPMLSDEDLSELRLVVTGNDKPFKNLEKFVEEHGAVFGSIYGRTENALILYTEKGKWSEGYLIGDHDVQVDPDYYPDMDVDDNYGGVLIVDGESTEDLGTINKYGKVDLDIKRTDKKISICGDVHGANDKGST